MPRTEEAVIRSSRDQTQLRDEEVDMTTSEERTHAYHLPDYCRTIKLIREFERVVREKPPFEEEVLPRLRKFDEDRKRRWDNRMID